MNESNGQYCCPGQGQPISRSLHLARLANYYRPCAICPQRHDTGTLSARRVRRIAEVHQRWSHERSPWSDDGLLGVIGNEVTAGAARQFGYLCGRSAGSPPGAKVAVAGDGRETTPELVASVSQGLQCGDVELIDLGACSAPALIVAMVHCGAAAGVYVGNPTHDRHWVGIRAWLRSGQPVSAGRWAAPVEGMSPASVPVTPTGRRRTLRRHDAAGGYLKSLQGYFHALRPLRLAVDVQCRPVLQYLHVLSGMVALQIDQLFSEGAMRLSERMDRQAIHDLKGPSDNRLMKLCRQVVASRADLGIWIDGDGEACQVVDELGRAVDGERLLPLLASAMQAETDGQTAPPVVVESPPRLPLTGRGWRPWRIVAANSQRRAMFDAMASHRAVLGGGNSGRFWFDADAPRPDALKALAVLLTALSQNDRTFSQAVAHCLDRGPAAR